jgi:hypothetical protein
VAAREALARRQAWAAVALVQLDRAELAWPLLRHGPDPGRRTWLLHGLGRLKTGPGAVLRRLEEETDVSARRALILSLGEFSAEQLPAPTRQALVGRLLRWYRDDPDPGTHSAVDWLLRHGWQGKAKRKLDWGQGQALSRIDRELGLWRATVPLGGCLAAAGGGPFSALPFLGPRLAEPRLATFGAARRAWYVTGEGHTLAVVRGPVEGRMGSPPHEPDRVAVREAPHRKRIPRDFAIATKEVTVAQFQRFLDANPHFKARRHLPTRRFTPEPDGPVNYVTWFEAVAYCNWLSRQEGVPEEEWCYPPLDRIDEGMRLRPGYLARTGYRLPTEAEWEYACRAEATTSRFYGSSEALLRIDRRTTSRG